MSQANVDTVMSRNVVSVGPDDTLEAADALMVEKGIRHLVVLDHGRVVGVLSERDLLRSALAKVLGFGESDRHGLMKTIRVREVVREAPVVTVPEAPLSSAADLLVRRRVGCLPVVSGDSLVGVVTSTDLVRHGWGDHPPVQPVAHVPGRPR
jgi:acetoin utilization protein AcuB